MPPETGEQQPDDLQDGGRQEERGESWLSQQTPDVQRYVGKLRSENANHRSARRDVETERDQLREQLQRFQRQQVDAMVGERLVNTDDFWLMAEMGDLVDAETGAPDEAKVSAAVETILEQRPHWAKQPKVPDFDQGYRGGGQSQQPPRLGEGFKNALQGR